MRTFSGISYMLLSFFFALPAFAQTTPNDQYPVNTFPSTYPWSLGPEEKIAIGSANRFYNDMIGEGTSTYYLKYRKELALTEKQIDQLRKKRAQDIKARDDYAARLNMANNELSDLLEEKTKNMDAIEKKIREIEKLRADFRIAVIKTQKEADDLLDLKQQALAEQLKVKLNNPASPNSRMPKYRDYYTPEY
jgi:hypothetical protein